MCNKKILIVTSEFPPLPGGIGNHALNLATSLHVLGYAVTILTDQRVQSTLEKEFDDKLGFHVVRIKLEDNRKKMYVDRLRKLSIYYKKNDTIIASGKFSIWLVGLCSIFYKNRKTITVVHGTEVNLVSSFLTKITSFCLKRMDVVISVSNFTKKFTDHLELNESIVIPNGFTIEKHRLTKCNYETYPNLVTVGRVSERKGQIHVIEALPSIKLKYPNVCYRMIGIPEDRERIEQRAKELGVLDNIIFCGKLEYDKLYSIVSASDVFMMLSKNDAKGDVEGFGIAILEANSFKLPAIGSKGCGIEDAIKHGESGALVSPMIIDEVLKALDILLENKTLFSQKSLEWSNNFRWEKIIQHYIKQIDK